MPQLQDSQVGSLTVYRKARSKRMHKRLFISIAAFCIALACVSSQTNYVFTADGKLAASTPRQLPENGRDFSNGSIVSNLTAQSSEVLVRCGWYRVEMPQVELGILQYVATTGYVFNASAGVATALVVVKDEAPVKKYTKYKIIGLLMKLGKWQQVKQYLVDNDMYDLFMGAQFLSNADENFMTAKKAMGQLLQIDEAVIDELLESCVDTD